MKGLILVTAFIMLSVAAAVVSAPYGTYNDEYQNKVTQAALTKAAHQYAAHWCSLNGSVNAVCYTELYKTYIEGYK